MGFGAPRVGAGDDHRDGHLPWARARRGRAASRRWAAPWPRSQLPLNQSDRRRRFSRPWRPGLRPSRSRASSRASRRRCLTPARRAGRGRVERLVLDATAARARTPAAQSSARPASSTRAEVTSADLTIPATVTTETCPVGDKQKWGRGGTAGLLEAAPPFQGLPRGLSVGLQQSEAQDAPRAGRHAPRRGPYDAALSSTTCIHLHLLM